MSRPLLFVVILNWNNPTDTVACLDSLEQSDYSACSVVVDNGSCDDSVRIIRDGYPGVKVIENPVNLGYARGNNIGIRYAMQAGAAWVLLLNNDATVAPDCLAELVRAGEDTPDAGALGPLVYHADAPEEVQAAGGFSTRGLDYRWRGAGEADVGQFDLSGVQSVDLLPGCALLLSRDVLEEVGPFDERFFLYREDIDLCLRIAAAGYGLYLVPSARAWHRRPGVEKGVPPHVVYHMARNSLLLARKHRRPIEFIKFLWQDLRTWAWWHISPRWRGMDAQAAARAAGVRDYFLGRFGPSERWSPGGGASDAAS